MNWRSLFCVLYQLDWCLTDYEALHRFKYTDWRVWTFSHPPAPDTVIKVSNVPVTSEVCVFACGFAVLLCFCGKQTDGRSTLLTNAGASDGVVPSGRKTRGEALGPYPRNTSTHAPLATAPGSVILLSAPTSWTLVGSSYRDIAQYLSFWNRLTALGTVPSRVIHVVVNIRTSCFCCVL